jgi:3',5'-cyclic AMP phosphodiesterase CpdA
VNPEAASTLKKAVAAVNGLKQKPDFVVFTGDLTHTTDDPKVRRARMAEFRDIVSDLKIKDVRFMPGEHDASLDRGEAYQEFFGKLHYSFDHKGVHFVVLNSILTHDDWTFNRWPSAEQRMLEMAGLDNPNGSPFMVGEKQRAWLAADLDKVDKATPLVVFSHSPLQKLYKGWNFWTDDAEEVQALLAPFEKVNVIYGHVHQIQYNQIGKIAFNSVMATAWPWPYPGTYAQAQHAMPVLTVPMNRADPFFERDATGWQFIDVHTGRVALKYNLYNNAGRTVAWNPATGRPEDTVFQDPAKRIPPQVHY